MEPYQQLEKEWAEFNNLDPAGMVACSSGTAALHLALEALQLPPGSEVIVPDWTMVACARAVTLAGLEPVFVDCDVQLLMDPKLLWDAYQDLETDHQVVMFVHVYGRRCEIDPELKDETTWIIEDLAEAHGIRTHQVTDAACWSFYRNKIVAGEEGGAVWFRDPEYADLARQLRSLGFTDAHDFSHAPRGHNYRMSNAHAACVLEQGTCRLGVDGSLAYNLNGLPSYQANLRLRRQIERWYDVACPAEWRMPPRDAPWVYDLRVPGMDGAQQDALVKELRLRGFQARHGFMPMSLQREYGGRCKWVHRMGYPAAWAAAEEVFYLPIQPGVTTEEDARLAFEVIRRVVS